MAGVGVASFLQNMTCDIILCSGEEKSGTERKKEKGRHKCEKVQ